MDIGLGPTITLESRFVDLDRPILLTGIQALVRVLLEQARLDRAAGLQHRRPGLRLSRLAAGRSGSRSSGVAQKLLTEHDIRFQPGVNEDLAATMLYGTQQLDAFPGKRVDGVFGMWYGKGPGSIAAGDALHCANMSRHRYAWRGAGGMPATTTARIPPPIRTRPSTCSKACSFRC